MRSTQEIVDNIKIQTTELNASMWEAAENGIDVRITPSSLDTRTVTDQNRVLTRVLEVTCYKLL